mgnify:CR=1 FL=1
MKLFKTLYIIAFLTISLAPLLAMPFYQNNSSENRVLAKMPQVVENGTINNRYFSSLDQYFSDNFAGRLGMVQLNELLYISVLKQAANEKVVYGRDSWLYFHETISDYVGQTQLSDSDIQRLVTVLTLQSQYLQQQGIPFVFTVAPNKNTIYPEYMPERYYRSSKPTVLERLTGALKNSGVIYSDITAALASAKSKERVYHKTDTHWNDLGARVGFNRLMADIKTVLPAFSYDDFSRAEAEETTAPGDLKKMLFPMAKEADEGRTSLRIEKKHSPQTPYKSVEDPQITTTSQVNGRRIMMFRDSFGNAIIPFVSDNFGYAYYSREYPVNLTGLDTHNPDVVVYEIVQRNIPKLLERAPIMPALPREFAIPSASNAGGRLYTRKKGDYIHIYGYLEDESGDSYRSYVTLKNRKVYEAFPILESGLSPDLPQSGKAAGFSLYLKSQEYSPGITVTLDFSDRAKVHRFQETGGI